jgi:hypothetical protein
MPKLYLLMREEVREKNDAKICGKSKTCFIQLSNFWLATSAVATMVLCCDICLILS